jgi:hypothetical protein
MLKMPITENNFWTREEAISICAVVEMIAPEFGCHVALTGGCLYKSGQRKDCYLLFYRIRQTPQVNYDGLFSALAKYGLLKVSGFGWCHKGVFKGKNVDMFFPEEQSGEYQPGDGGTCISDFSELVKAKLLCS